MGKIIWLLRSWLEWELYHAAHRLTELSWRLSPKPPENPSLRRGKGEDESEAEVPCPERNH